MLDKSFYSLNKAYINLYIYYFNKQNLTAVKGNSLYNSILSAVYIKYI